MWWSLAKEWALGRENDERRGGEERKRECRQGGEGCEQGGKDWVGSTTLFRTPLI